MERNPGTPFELNGPRLPKAGTSYNRRRAGNACLVCRSRKTKCDNTRPVCGFCAATGGNCQYVDSDSSQLDRGTLAILQRLSQLESSLSKHVDNSLQQQTNFLSHVRVSQTSERSPFQEPSLPAAQEHASISGSPGNMSGERSVVDPNIIAPSTSYSKQQQDYIDDHSSENMPPSSEMLNASSEASLDSLLKWPIFSEAAPHLEPSFQVPSIERVEAIQGDGRTVLNNARKHGTTLLNLDHKVVNDLVDNFLVNNHIKNPILDVDSLRNDVRAFTETGPGWDGKSCLILLVCAVSVLSAPLEQECEPGHSKDPERLSIANAYFEASQRRIGMLYHENSIVSAQCSFLTAVYLMSTLQILAAWKCFVQAGAQFLAWMKSNGRWRHTEDLSNPNPDQENPWLQMSKVARERHVEDSLYWSCLKSEIEIRFELGMPGSGICEMDYPHLFPSPPEDTEDQEMSPDNSSDVNWSSPKLFINSFDRQHLEKAWYFYLAEIALKRMLHNVIVRRFQSKARGRATNESRFECNVREFDVQVEQWYQTLPALMSFSMQADVHTTDILRLILRGHMIDIKNFVRFPALLEVFVAQDPVSITELSPTHLRLVQEALQSAADCIDSNRPSFFHRHQGTWLMARSCTRSALHLLGMALKCHFAGAAGGVHPVDLERQFLPPRWKGLVEEMSAVLEYWSDENNDLATLGRLYKELLKVYEDSAGIRLS